MAENRFAVAIVGGGPGGYVAAIKAAQHGLNTALVEQRYLGGTCLNIGCIPTKVLLASAGMWRELRGARDFGITVEGMSFDFSKMMGRKERIVKQLRGGVEFLMKKNKVTVFNARGTLTGIDTIGLTGAQPEEIAADHIILATGSVPSRPPIPGMDGKNVLTSDDILCWPDVPKSLAVIGGGAIGLEFAFFFNALGAKVTVLEGLSHILPLEDEQVAAELAASLKRQGITLQADAMVQEIGEMEGQKTVSYQVRGQEEKGVQQATAEVVLVATGRWPNTKDCGCEAQGITIERRAVKVNEYLHTGVGNIYAIGDAIGGLLLAHKAGGRRGGGQYHRPPSTDGISCHPHRALLHPRGRLRRPARGGGARARDGGAGRQLPLPRAGQSAGHRRARRPGEGGHR